MSGNKIYFCAVKGTKALNESVCRLSNKYTITCTFGYHSMGYTKRTKLSFYRNNNVSVMDNSYRHSFDSRVSSSNNLFVS